MTFSFSSKEQEECVAAQGEPHGEVSALGQDPACPLEYGSHVICSSGVIEPSRESSAWSTATMIHRQDGVSKCPGRTCCLPDVVRATVSGEPVEDCDECPTSTRRVESSQVITVSDRDVVNRDPVDTRDELSRSRRPQVREDRLAMA